MEDKKENAFLPIGTVVLLKNASKRLMITGFFPVADEKTYDYCGCLYPEGFLSMEDVFLFNDDEVEKVCFLGLFDDETEEYEKVLLSVKDELK